MSYVSGWKSGQAKENSPSLEGECLTRHDDNTRHASRLKLAWVNILPKNPYLTWQKMPNFSLILSKKHGKMTMILPDCTHQMLILLNFAQKSLSFHPPGISRNIHPWTVTMWPICLRRFQFEQQCGIMAGVIDRERATINREAIIFVMWIMNPRMSFIQTGLQFKSSCHSVLWVRTSNRKTH